MENFGLPRVFVIMGVSGSGKSAVGRALAQRFQGGFLDGDYLHPRANVEKMNSGLPLDDDDRLPWLQRINDAIFAMSRTHDKAFIACSALKKSYREIIRRNNPHIIFVYLDGTEELIHNRLLARIGHFFQPAMLASQFASLEVPATDEPDVIAISVEGDIDQVVERVVHAIHSL